IEFDLAGRVAQGSEEPAPVQVLEGPLLQTNMHLERTPLGIFGREVRLDAVIIDVDRRNGKGVGSFVKFGATAPWQEMFIVLAPVHEREHLLRGEFDQNELLDVSHVWEG